MSMNARKPIYKTRKPLRERSRFAGPALLTFVLLALLAVFAGSMLGGGPQQGYASPQTPVTQDESIWVIPETGGSPRGGNEMRQSLICAAEAVDCPEPAPGPEPETP
jgi:hypothetical protein